MVRGRSRIAFQDELEALRLQVELLTIQVGEAVRRARRVVATGDRAVADELIASDDTIDAAAVSLTDACYHLLAREAPVASDLRLVVSVIRVVHTLERIGDLSLRVARTVDEHPLLASRPEVHEILVRLADNVAARFAAVQEGWSAVSVAPLERLDTLEPLADFADELVRELVALDGPGAVQTALAAAAVGRAFDRIGDHCQIMACRLKYLVTGDVAYLADEVAW